MADRQITVRLVGDPGNLGSTLKNAGADADGFQSHLSGLGGKLGELGGALGKLALVGGAAMGGLAVAGAGALLKLGSDFDESYDKIQTATGATGSALEGLKNDFKAAFSAVPTDMASASDAIGELNQTTGATGKTLQTMAETALELSRITKTDLSTNIKEATSLANNWGVSADGVSGLMDKLFVASQKTGVSVADLAKGVTDSSATFRAMGLSVDESIALVAGLGKAGIDSSTAIAGITKAVGKFATEGIDAKTGIAEMFDAIKSAKSSTEATALAVDTFGAKAGPKLADQIRSGKFSVDELTKAITDSSGAVIKTGEDTADFGERWTEFKNKAEVALEPLAGQVFELANRLTDVLVPALTKVGDFIEGKVVPAITAFISTNVVPVVKDIADGFERVALAVAKFAEVKFDAIAPQLDSIGKTLKGIDTETFSSAWKKVVDAVQPAVDVLKPLAEQVLADLKTQFEKIAEALGPLFEALKPLEPVLKPLAEALGVVLVGAISALLISLDLLIKVFAVTLVAAIDTLTVTIKGITAGFEVVTDFLTSWGPRLLNGVTGAFSAVTDWFHLLPGNILSALGDVGGLFESLGKEMLNGIVAGIEDIAETLYRKATDVAGKVASIMNPKNWFGSPQGIQNWYPYYFTQGMDNLAAAAQNSPGLSAAVAAVKAKMAEASDAVKQSAASMTSLFQGNVVPTGDQAADARLKGIAGYQAVAMANMGFGAGGTAPSIDQTLNPLAFQAGYNTGAPFTGAAAEVAARNALPGIPEYKQLIQVMVDGQVLAEAVNRQNARAYGQ